VYDTGVETAPDGSPQLWLIMQLLRGSTLEALLDHADYVSTPPGVPWAVAIAAQIAAVLADVHRVDIVHRDIKPANVMIVDGGLVKVLDFGIAILRGAGAAAPADAGGPHCRHAGLHVAGTVPRAGSHLGVRHLLARLPAA
jgi:serine/threonine protein kinase